MTDMPTKVTIPLPNLERAALKTLLDHAPPGMQLDELAEGVFLLGLCALLKQRPVSDISIAIDEKVGEGVSMGAKRLVRGSRPEADYLGFSILPGQVAALAKLEAKHALVDEDVICQIVLSVGLRALPDDKAAQLLLEAGPNLNVKKGDN